MNLKAAAATAGVSMAEIARWCEIHPESLYKIARGACAPSRVTYLRLKAALPELGPMETREQGRPRKNA